MTEHEFAQSPLANVSSLGWGVKGAAFGQAQLAQRREPKLSTIEETLRAA